MPILFYAWKTELPFDAQVYPWPSVVRAQTALDEFIFDDVRGKEFAHRPSRLESVHLVESEADAVEFSMEYRQHGARPHISFHGREPGHGADPAR
jgi:hypothetical protein